MKKMEYRNKRNIKKIKPDLQNVPSDRSISKSINRKLVEKRGVIRPNWPPETDVAIDKWIVKNGDKATVTDDLTILDKIKKILCKHGHNTSDDSIWVDYMHK